MPRVFKVLDAKEVIKILESFGFIVKSQNGSHIKLIHTGTTKNTVAVVPNHKPLKQGTMISIYKQILELESIDINRLNNLFKN